MPENTPNKPVTGHSSLDLTPKVSLVETRVHGPHRTVAWNSGSTAPDETALRCTSSAGDKLDGKQCPAFWPNPAHAVSTHPV